MVYDAVCRNLEIIGEAAGRLDDGFRAAHPDVPWRATTDARNILIHAYYRVAPEILVDIVKDDIPKLWGPWIAFSEKREVNFRVIL